MKLSDFKVLTFDCYGTLIDWESGMIQALAPLTERLDGQLTRDAVLEAHARHETAQERQTPHKRYSEILAIIYKRLAEEWGLSVSWDECVRYGSSIPDWPAFPDSAEALRYLKQHYQLVILSNVDNASFAASNQKLGVSFDAIYTAEDIGSYKPAAANFEYMLAQLQARGHAKADILHTAESLFHDHAPANQHGLRSCWIYRRYAQPGFGATLPPAWLDQHQAQPGLGATLPPVAMPRYDFRFTSLQAMVAAHQRGD